jgi:hypothetical protein
LVSLLGVDAKAGSRFKAWRQDSCGELTPRAALFSGDYFC